MWGLLIDGWIDREARQWYLVATSPLPSQLNSVASFRWVLGPMDLPALTQLSLRAVYSLLNSWLHAPLCRLLYCTGTRFYYCGNTCLGAQQSSLPIWLCMMLAPSPLSCTYHSANLRCSRRVNRIPLGLTEFVDSEIVLNRWWWLILSWCEEYEKYLREILMLLEKDIYKMM